MRRLALAFLCIGALSGGFASILIRLCRYPAPTVACLRLLLAGLLLSAHFQCWVLGLQHTSVANATFLMCLTPVFFALAQRFGTRRRLPAGTLASLGLAAAGAAWLLLRGGGRLGRLGDLLVLAAALLYVGYLLAARRAAGDLPHLAFAQITYFWGGLSGLPAALLAGGLPEGARGDPVSLAALAGLVLFPTLVGHTSLNFGVRHLPPLTVSFFSLAEPVVATSAALLLLGEPLRPLDLPAYGLLLAATLLYLLLSTRRSER